MKNFDKAFAYCKRIRNVEKKKYAFSYLDYLKGKITIEPEAGSLSYMGAQAVRMNLSDLIFNKEV